MSPLPAARGPCWEAGEGAAGAECWTHTISRRGGGPYPALLGGVGPGAQLLAQELKLPAPVTQTLSARGKVTPNTAAPAKGTALAWPPSASEQPGTPGGLSFLVLAFLSVK